MKALQALVIGMGVLIFVLLGVVVWRLATITTGGGDEPPTAAATPAFTSQSLDLPPDCRIADTTTDAGHLIIRTTGPRQPCDAAHIFDLETGAAVGTITP